MDTAYISTLSALAGTVIGALSTFATSWMTQTTQAKVARLNAERDRRSELYGRFMEETARLYSHAVSEETVDFSQLVNIYALKGRILLQSSDEVAQRADAVITLLVEIYLAPNRNAADVFHDSRQRDPMRPFAEACRAELRSLR